MRVCIFATFAAFLVMMLPICSAKEIKLSYDANGNLVTGDGEYRVYNSLNQLWKVYEGNSTSGPILEELTYHPLEERVLLRKVYEGGSLRETVYYVDENDVRVVNGSGSFDFAYVFHEGLLVGQMLPGGARQFVHVDHKGSVYAVTDLYGKVIENTSYSPFGEVLEGGKESCSSYEHWQHLLPGAKQILWFIPKPLFLSSFVPIW